MEKNVFDVLKKMNENDINNKTKNIVVSPYFLRSQKTNRGGEVTMGVANEVFVDAMNDKIMYVLLAINKEEYNKLK